MRSTDGVEQSLSAGTHPATARHLNIPMFHAQDCPAQPQARLYLEKGAREHEGVCLEVSLSPMLSQANPVACKEAISKGRIAFGEVVRKQQYGLGQHVYT